MTDNLALNEAVIASNKKIVALLSEAKEHALAKLSVFHSNFMSDPFYYLEWSDDMFGYAAALTLSSRWLASISDCPDKDWGKVMIESLTESVMRASRNTNYSTSPSTNVANRSMLAAESNLLQAIT